MVKFCRLAAQTLGIKCLVISRVQYSKPARKPLGSSTLLDSFWWPGDRYSPVLLALSPQAGHPQEAATSPRQAKLKTPIHGPMGLTCVCGGWLM